MFNESGAQDGYTAGVRPGSKLWGSMLKREVTDLDDFYERAQKYIRVEDGHENLKVGNSESHVKSPANEGSNRAHKCIRVEEGHNNSHVEESEPSSSGHTTNVSGDSI